MPNPYTVECPVLLKTSDSMPVATRKVGVFLPHEWFHWMCMKDGVSGLQNLKNFWDECESIKELMKNKKHTYSHNLNIN